MTIASEMIRNFYTALSAGKVESATSLMTHDIEWITVQRWPEVGSDQFELLSTFIAQALAERYGRGWTFRMNGRGPEEVAQYVLRPFVGDGLLFAPSLKEFKAEDDKIVWLGNLTCVHTDGDDDLIGSAYAHIWTLRDGKIARLREYIYDRTIQEGSLQ